MNVSPNELRRQTVSTLKDVDNQIRTVSEYASARSIPVEKLQASDGTFVLVPLLLAKAQCLNTLTLLRDQK